MRLLFSILIMFYTGCLVAQETEETRNSFTFNLNRTSGVITIDGQGDDEAWSSAAKISQFENHWPIDGGVSDAQTEV